MNVKVTSRTRYWKQVDKTWQLLLFVVPAIVLIFIFNYLPMYGVLMAFQNYKPSQGFLGSEWVGLKYFLRFFHSANSAITIKNTVLTSLFTMVFSFPVPILLALMINQIAHPRYKKAVQTITYLPYFISTVVVIAIMNLFLSPQRGFYGIVARSLGIFDAPNLLMSTSWFRPLYIASGIWQTAGYSSIIYLAALSAVDPALYEAATIDGANKLQRIIHVDIPTIMPTVTIMLILACGSLMNVGFEKIYLMQNSLNLGVSEVLQTYVYKVGILNSQYSFSAAINLMNTLINFILLMLVNGIARKVGETSLF